MSEDILSLLVLPERLSCKSRLLVFWIMLNARTRDCLVLRKTHEIKKQSLSLSHVVFFLDIPETEHFPRTLHMNVKLQATLSQECTRLTKGQQLDK